MKAICVIFLLWIGHVQSSCFKDNPSANSSWHWRPSIGSKYAKLENADQCLKKCLDDYNCVAITYWVAQKECYSFNFMVEEESCKDTCESKMITLPIPQFCNKLVNTYNQDNMRELQNACLPTLELCKKNMKLKAEIQLEKEETKERLEKLENKKEQEIEALVEAKIKNSTNKFQSGLQVLDLLIRQKNLEALDEKYDAKIKHTEKNFNTGLQRLQHQQNVYNSNSINRYNHLNKQSTNRYNYLNKQSLNRYNHLNKLSINRYNYLNSQSISRYNHLKNPECNSYMTLSSGTRSINHRHSDKYCDRYHPNDYTSSDWIGAGWYRFVGHAGTRMPTSRTPTRRCNTHATAWMTSSHPRSKGQTNNVTFCFSWTSSCWSSTRGKVTNCGSFYVYYLPSVPTCHAKYCGV